MIFKLKTAVQPAAVCAASALWVLIAALACAPKASVPASVVAAPVAAAPAVMQTCPSPTDGPSIVVNAVYEAHRAWVANSATQLPPACVLAAVARISAPLPDSLSDQTLALAGELRRRGSDQRELLSTEIMLLGRKRQYAEVSRAYDRLAVLDSQPPIDVLRFAIAAAHQRADTAALLRIFPKMVNDPAAGAAVRAEYNVVRQVGAVLSAINEAKGLVRQNPKYVAGYPSIVGNYGTLAMPDSVVAYLRRALAQNAPRATLSSALETTVTTMLRHATLYGRTYGWDTRIAAAVRVDSALSSPSTKFLVAALIILSAEPQVAEISAQLGGATLGSQQIGVDRSQPGRANACQRIAPLSKQLDVAEARLREGGDRYAGGGVAQFAANLSAVRGRLASLQAVCAG